MGLIGNFSVLNKSCATFTNGTATAGAYAGNTRSNANTEIDRITQSGFFPAITSIPDGYPLGDAYTTPRSSGGIGASTSLSGALTNTGNLAGGLNAVAPLTALGQFTNAEGRLVVQAVAALTAAISTTNAALELLACFSAGLSGSISVNATIQAIQILEAEADLTGSGVITNAQLGAIISMVANPTASVTISTGILKALGALESDIGGPVELSPAGLAAALLDDNDIETGYSMREALRIILTAMGGKVSGAGTSTITFRNVTDDKDRIVATVDNDGNRSVVTLDVSDV
jgi:hypothetical protein